MTLPLLLPTPPPISLPPVQLSSPTFSGDMTGGPDSNVFGSHEGNRREPRSANGRGAADSGSRASNGPGGADTGAGGGGGAAAADSLNDIKASVPRWLTEAADCLQLVRQLGQSPADWAGISPAHASSRGQGRANDLWLGAGFEREPVAAAEHGSGTGAPEPNRAPRELLRRGWARLVNTGPTRKLLVISNLRREMAVADMTALLKRCAALYGGVTDKGLFLPVDEQGRSRGYAVLELRQARLAAGCAQALMEEPRLAAEGQLGVQPLQVTDENGKPLPLPTVPEAESGTTDTSSVAAAAASGAQSQGRGGAEAGTGAAAGSQSRHGSSSSAVAGGPPAAPPLPSPASGLHPSQSDSGSGSKKQQELVQTAVDDYLRSKLLEDGDLSADLQYILLNMMTGGTAGDQAHAALPVDDVLKATQLNLDSPISAVTPAAIVRTYLQLAGPLNQPLQNTVLAFSVEDRLQIQHLLSFSLDRCQQHPQAVAHALLWLGYDLQLRRVREVCRAAAEFSMLQHTWTAEADAQLVHHADVLARNLHMNPLQLSACDVELSDAELMDRDRRLLRSYSPKDLRLRLAMLQAFNAQVPALLPIIDLRAPQPWSAASAVRNVRPLIFYSVQHDWLHGLLEDTAQRVDSRGPEITLNPLAVLPISMDAVETEAAEALTEEAALQPASSALEGAAGANITERDLDVEGGVAVGDGAARHDAPAGAASGLRARQTSAGGTSQQQQQQQPPLDGSVAGREEDEDEDDGERAAGARLQPLLLSAARQSQFADVMIQLEKVHPAELRVKPAHGGDPIFPLAVKLTGERVAGNSGSFRDFMLRMAHELQSDMVPLLMLCPSAGVGRNVGRWLLRPGPHTFPVIKQMRFMGQLIGLALRSGVPLDLDLLPSFWRALMGDVLSRRDIYDADKLLDDHLRAVEEANTPQDFEIYTRQHPLTFVVRSMTGVVRPLVLPEGVELGRDEGAAIPASPVADSESTTAATTPSASVTSMVAAAAAGLGVAPGQSLKPAQTGFSLGMLPRTSSESGGRAPGEESATPAAGAASRVTAPAVPFHLRQLYIQLVEEARLEELSNDTGFAAIREGLRSVVPIEVLQVLSWQAMELRVCGVPDVDLNFLRRHTTYTSGLSETDPHIVHFWEALERMSASELRKFIKFACNQERIPSAYPDEDGGGGLKHVPPYPMKIAPPDEGAWRPNAGDDRLIRAETCMFMVKLPQYSTLDVMIERLRQAISCRDDPLIG